MTMDEMGNGDDDQEKKMSGDQIAFQLQKIQADIEMLELHYPDLRESLEEVKSRLSAHEALLHQLDQRAMEKSETEGVDAVTADIVAKAMESTIKSMNDLHNEAEAHEIEIAQFDVMITQLTKARSELLRSYGGTLMKPEK